MNNNTKLDELIDFKISLYNKNTSFKGIENVLKGGAKFNDKGELTLPNYSSQLESEKEIRTIEDGFSYIGDRFKLLEKQSSALGLFYFKLAKKEPVTINCIGTSITEGWDNVSKDTVPAPNNPTAKVATITYPQKLEDMLRDMYQYDINVVNQGFSGTTVKRAYERLANINLTGDVSILEFGANDSSQTEIPDFIEYLNKLIVREISNNRAVILLLPSKTKETTNSSRRAFSNAIKSLANNYGIPIFDTYQFLSNCDTSFYSDGVHLNKKGYSYFGVKVAAIIGGLGIGYTPIVNSGDSLLCRPTIDGIIYSKNSDKNVTSQPTIVTPLETSTTHGIVANLKESDESYVYFTFYTDSDNLLVHPSIRLDNPTELEITLNDGIGYPNLNNNLDSNIKKHFSSGTIIKYSHVEKSINQINYNNSPFPPILIPKKGFNTLKIKSKGGQVLIYSLDFISTDQISKNVYIESIDKNDEINETRVNITKLNNSFNFLLEPIYHNLNPLLCLKWVGSQNSSSIAYFRAGHQGSITGWILVSSVSNYGENGRKIKEIYFDPNTKDLRILWDGNTSETGTLSITI